MLGHKVCQVLAEHGHQVFGTLRGPEFEARRFGVFDGVDLVAGIDVLDDVALRAEIESRRPDFVVNAVGIVKQRDQMSDPYSVVAVNSLLPHHLAKICRHIGARLIHVSSDCVFNGRRGNYGDSDPGDAEDLYGRSKLLGETTSGEEEALTLRTSFVGRELKRPFHGLVEWLLSQQGGRVRGFANVIYSGLTSLELSRIILRVVEGPGELCGTLQVASEPVNKYDLLHLIRDAYGLDIKIDRSETPRLDRSLVMDGFTAATGYEAPKWSNMIQRMAEDRTPYDRIVR